MASQNQPVKVPVILQMEALECGAASLAMILAYYKKWVPLEEIRQACGVSRDGSNALNVARAAKGYGLNYKSLFISAKNIQKKATYPAIIFWNNCHFVVLDGFKKNYAYLNDPAAGRVRLPMEEFNRAYSNVCIVFEKGEDFVPGGKPASTLDFLKYSLKGNSSAVALVMITSTLAMIAGTLIPVISRVFTDYVLSGRNPSWIQGLLLLFLGVIVFQLVTGILHFLYMRKATGKIAVTANASFMHHLFRLPMAFFSQRLAGDLTQRAVSNDRVASSLVGRLAPVVVNLVLLVFYLVVMFSLSLPLTAVGLLTVLVNLVLARIISNKRTEMSMTRMRDQSIMPMGMHTLISEGGGGVSGGQKQRILIARAFCQRPGILLLDEATSALDNITQKIVTDSLDQMKCTRIVIAHRLSTIRSCDRIIVLDKGAIAEDGTYDDLIARGGYFAELVERQRLDGAD